MSGTCHVERLLDGVTEKPENNRCSLSVHTLQTGKNTPANWHFTSPKDRVFDGRTTLTASKTEGYFSYNAFDWRI